MSKSSSMTNYTLTIGDEVHQLTMSCDHLACQYSRKLLTSRAQSLVNDPDHYIKISFTTHETESAKNEISNYRELQRYGITPVLVECRESVITAELVDVDYQDIIDQFEVSILILTKIGMSLNDMFVPESLTKKYLGPGPPSRIIVNSDSGFDNLFPEAIFHDDIRGKIRELLIKLTQLGWSHDDIHSGNILIEDDKLYLIDLELMTRID